MKRRALAFIFLFVFLLPTAVYSQTTTYTVQPGDSMWKIAVRYQVGLSELIAANPHIKVPSLIYPNQKITIPEISEKSFEAQVVQLVNQKRAEAGLKPLTHNWELSRVARYKSADMRDRNYFSHTSPTYGSPFTMMKNFGISYRTAGENIAQGQATPQAVVDAWMNSSGHRANILSTQFTEIGVGYASGGSGRHYWTQMFIGK
ncbi:SafA/ExsA family spore coat assembly protein [Fervidibacillus halotolerans]|uniref:SafA/ExsA family spore coat assembly protein n=1 Tax=Fervidibacillus halotolerans TaxID=2980027 RepID=A0A9E8M046_9BACI|nr:SafA/ExsA family spore coat assembly protein [Fervidibacillus halotolerans]WAA12485.1 SafA/ExsA family spore coat assembly protein [Fervidibacillus halotolerans]